MKSLTDFLSEKLVIIPSQVDEKLVINKNYKSPGINNTIYDAFNLLVLDKLIKKLTEEVNTDNNIYENVSILGGFFTV